MKRYITTSIGIVAGISFGGFVAYATAHTSPMEYVSETWVQDQDVAESEISADDIKTLSEQEVTNETVGVTDTPTLTPDNSEVAPLVEIEQFNDEKYTYDHDDEDEDREDDDD